MAFNRNPAFGRGNLLPPDRPRFGADKEPATTPEDSSLLETPAEPIFEQRRAATAPEKCANVIAAEAKWKGTLTIPDSVRIDGQFNGDIDAKGTVHVSEGASVEAKIKATFVVIGGSFRGEVRCTERTELLAKAKVLGDVITKLFTIHEGAVIDGSIHMSGDKLPESGKPSTSASGRAGEPSNGTRSARTEASTVTGD